MPGRAKTRYRSPLVRAFPFLQCLRNLHHDPFDNRWALQWCACLPKQLCLISRFCSSVPDFAVWLPSVYGSPQTTLPLANTSGRYPAYKGFTPSGKIHTCYLSVLKFVCIFKLFQSLQQVCSLLMQGAHMQPTKLGFCRLSKGCGSHQVLCSLTGNRSELPNFAYCQRWQPY